MYAVIRAGGKQYRVAPGDIIRVEKQATGTGNLEFELLAVGDNGKISRPEGEARVTAKFWAKAASARSWSSITKRKSSTRSSTDTGNPLRRCA